MSRRCWRMWSGSCIRADRAARRLLCRNARGVRHRRRGSAADRARGLRQRPLRCDRAARRRRSRRHRGARDRPALQHPGDRLRAGADAHRDDAGQQVQRHRHLRSAQHALLQSGGAVSLHRRMRVDPLHRLSAAAAVQSRRAADPGGEGAGRSAASAPRCSSVRSPRPLPRSRRMAPRSSSSAVRRRSGCGRICSGDCKRWAGRCRCWKATAAPSRWRSCWSICAIR